VLIKSEGSVEISVICGGEYENVIPPIIVAITFATVILIGKLKPTPDGIWQTNYLKNNKNIFIIAINNQINLNKIK